MLVGAHSGGAIRLGDPVSVRVGQIDAPRGRVDLLPAAVRGGLRAGGEGTKAQDGRRETSRAIARPPTASTCSSGSNAGSC